MPKPYFAVLLATTMLVIGCGGGGNECCDPFEQSTVSKSAASGDAQSAVVGQVLPTTATGCGDHRWGPHLRP